MIITTFVFLGIEGASVYSRYAKRREDVGRATVLGFLSVLAIFSLVTLSSYSVMPQPEIAGTRQPSMVGLFESVVGDWGEVFISAAVIVSVLGAYLAWTLMAAEVMYIPARNDDLPAFLGRENASGTPITALVVTSIAVQSVDRLPNELSESIAKGGACTSLHVPPPSSEARTWPPSPTAIPRPARIRAVVAPAIFCTVAGSRVSGWITACGPSPPSITKWSA